ncbi:DUF433 domain-containing protein [soil metagenome]
MTVPVIAEHIEITPGTCGGKPRIAGHRITVQNIVICHERMGLSPDEILAAYPTITLADVYAALAYYHDNVAEIRESLRREEQVFSKLQDGQPSILEKIAKGQARSSSAAPPEESG